MVNPLGLGETRDIDPPVKFTDVKKSFDGVAYPRVLQLRILFEDGGSFKNCADSERIGRLRRGITCRRWQALRI